MNTLYVGRYKYVYHKNDNTTEGNEIISVQGIQPWQELIDIGKFTNNNIGLNISNIYNNIRTNKIFI